MSELEAFVEQMETKRAINTLRTGDLQVRKADGAPVHPTEKLRVIREIQASGERPVSPRDNSRQLVSPNLTPRVASLIHAAAAAVSPSETYAAKLNAEWAKVGLTSPEDPVTVTPLHKPMTAFADEFRLGGVRPQWQSTFDGGVPTASKDPWRP